MDESPDRFGALRVDSAAEQKRNAARIGVEHRPVEASSRTAVAVAAGVEQQVVGAIFVGPGRREVAGRRDADRLDDPEAALPKLPARFGRLVAVELEPLEAEASISAGEAFTKTPTAGLRQLRTAAAWNSSSGTQRGERG